MWMYYKLYMSTRHVSVQMYPVPNLPSSSTQRLAPVGRTCARSMRSTDCLDNPPHFGHERLRLESPSLKNVMYVCILYIYMTNDRCHMSYQIIYDICQIPGVVHGNWNTTILHKDFSHWKVWAVGGSALTPVYVMNQMIDSNPLI